MEEELNLDNILSTGEVDNLFSSDAEIQEESAPETSDNSDNTDNKEQGEVTEVNPDSLFEGEPESVGNDENNKEEGEDATPSKSSSSSQNNFYSSIATALKEEGIFPDLEDSTCSEIKNPEDFRDLIEQQIRANLDERQKRIDDALNAGVENSEIRRYESAVRFLDSIEDSALTDESDKGEKLRKDLIYQDFINRGYSQERAKREVTKSLNAGTDIEDAREALNSNKEFFNGQYDKLIENAQTEVKREEQARKEQAEQLRTSIFEDKKLFGEIEVDKNTRQKIFDNLAKPVYKDPNTGELYTSIQKYEMEHRTDFLKNVSILYTLTDGFKNIDALVKGKVKQEVRRGLRELENTINNTARSSDGSLKFVTGVSEDTESYIGKGWSLDV